MRPHRLSILFVGRRVARSGDRFEVHWSRVERAARLRTRSVPVVFKGHRTEQSKGHSEYERVCGEAHAKNLRTVARIGCRGVSHVRLGLLRQEPRWRGGGAARLNFGASLQRFAAMGGHSRAVKQQDCAARQLGGPGPVGPGPCQVVLR